MIDHVSCTVKNLKESSKFYMKVFNLKIIRKWERKEWGLSAVLLGYKTDCLIELIESKNPLQSRDAPGDFHRIGIRHMAFSVPNIEETIEKVTELGGKLVRGPEEGITVKKWAFVADVNGITIELMELK